jgi:Siphovirus Gp157
MSLSPLAMEMSKFRLLKERLMQIYSLDDDEETLADTLEGITNLHEMLSAIIRSALMDESLQEGLRSRLEEMKQRLARFEERGTKKRQVALEVMTEIGLKKLEQPDFTASTRSGSPSLVVVAEEIIPEAFWVPQPAKLDRQSLLAELRRGRDIPGAQLGNPKPTLAVRTK